MIRRHALALLCLPLAIACTGSSGGGAPGSPTDSVRIVAPTTGLHVTVALASAHLGAESCTHDESANVTSQSCANRPPDAGPSGSGPCGGPCDFSRIQLTFASEAGGAPTTVAVTSAVILDAVTGAELQALSAYTPLVWDGTAYRPWNESVPPSAEVKASYTLAPPSWSSFGGDTTSRAYKVRLGLRIDGSDVTLQSAEIHREPVAAT